MLQDDDKKMKYAQDLSASLGGSIRDQGGTAGGAMQGIQAGLSTGNPYAAAVGGVVGGVAGGMQAKIARRNANIDADIKEVDDKDKAQQQANMERRATLSGLASNLSATLLR